ncbi:hypothetical protein A5M85_03795 [Cellulophaga lytica]|uniref:hypothetical protein n=1 Tax=Cellulophaga lytica TaxID=979 RepID=UPI00095047D6|nr:hypothetical protein [Cellulophaga lytica]APU09434.1 hypothetical protein A5M85_03795 [Cellulophaga lytica]
MFTKKIHIKNKTIGIGFKIESKHFQKLYAIHFYTVKHAIRVGKDTKEKYFTFGILRSKMRIKVISHKRIHIKQRIA